MNVQIMAVTDQGLRRPVKVARLHVRTGTPLGFERKANEAGQVVDFAQSWLCSLDFTPVATDDDDLPRRVAKPVR